MLFDRARRRGLVVPALWTAVGLVVLLSLGTWQWQRRAWKEELIATIEARSTVAPLPPEAWRNLKCRPEGEVGLEASCDYMSVRLVGTFEHARERHVFISVPRQPSGVGGAGYWVFTPLRLSGGGEVYVNRGFVPEAAKPASQRPLGQIEGTIEVIGLIRSAEPRGLFSGRNDPAANVWYVRSPSEFGMKPPNGAVKTDGPEPHLFYVDQTGTPPPGGVPLPMAGKIALPNRHLEYALTWYGLAVTLVVVFLAFARSRFQAD